MQNYLNCHNGIQKVEYLLNISGHSKINKIARIAYEKPIYFLFSYIYILKVRDLTAGIKCFIPQEDIILDEFRFGRIEAGREVAYHQERSGGH